MSTCYIACKYCSGEIGSAQAMTILKETGQGIVEACHPECKPVRMKCLSVRQPWVDAIFRLGKNVENRSWRTNYRGPLLIHARKNLDCEACSRFNSLAGRAPSEEFVTGAIIGIVDLTDVMADSERKWADADSWNWLLANARLLAKPIPCAGKTGIFEVEIPLRAVQEARASEGEIPCQPVPGVGA